MGNYELKEFERMNQKDCELRSRYKGLQKRGKYSIIGSTISAGLAGLTTYLGWGQEISESLTNPYFITIGISTIGSIIGTAYNAKRHFHHKSKIEEIGKDLESVSPGKTHEEILKMAKEAEAPLRGIERYLENKVKNFD